MGNVEIPNWLKGLPLAPEFRPTDTEFADPIAYISKIEKEASAFGICKIIPPLPKPSKKYVFHNLNKSLSKCPELGYNVHVGNASNLSKIGCENGWNEEEVRALFTTRHQELGQNVKRAKGAGNSPQMCVQKQVWQSGEIYTLEQFESKSKAFARSTLGTVKEVSPLVVEAMFWKAASEKPIHVEYANDVPGTGFGEPECQFQNFHRRRRKRRNYRTRESFDCKNVDSRKDLHSDEIKDVSIKNDPNTRLELSQSAIASSTLSLDEASRSSRQTSLNAGSEMEGTAGWKLSNSPWNLQVIARSPGSLTRFMPDDIPGVTSPMVYIGMLYSWFAWHVEDHELHSMNFLHTGSSKTWYAVPGDYAYAFEEVLRNEAYGGNIDRLAALTLLGEKTTLLSPEVIVGSGIPGCRLVQNPGEFVVTFPRAYHMGFSHGFNCGEAANFGTPQWLKVAKEAAVRRAAMNYLPMLSHQQLLYLLTMSFVSRVPRSLLPGGRSSRLRDRQKEERELSVKKAFIEDMLNENNLLSILLGQESIYHAVLWDPDLLPSLRKESQLPCLTSTVSTTPTENVSNIQSENDKSSNLLDEMSLYMETLNDLYMDDDDISCDFQVDSGTLACVACGILGFPFMSVVHPYEKTSMELLPADHLLVQQGQGVSKPMNCHSSPVHDGSINGSVSDNLPPLHGISPSPKESITKIDVGWNASSGFLRPRIFCLEHAVQIEEMLRSKGGANVLVICHSDYQKIKAHAVVIAEEINSPFNYIEIPLDNASQEELNLIDLAIDDEHHDECGEEWTSKLGINLRYSVKVRKNSPSMQVQHALTLGGLFSDESLNSDFFNINWQARRSRSKIKSNNPARNNLCEILEKNDKLFGRGLDGVIVKKEEKILQYSRRNFKSKPCGSSRGHGLPRKHLPAEVSGDVFGDLDKHGREESENNLCNDGNTKKSSAVTDLSASIRMSEMQHEILVLEVTTGMRLSSVPAQVAESLVAASSVCGHVKVEVKNQTSEEMATSGCFKREHKIRVTEITSEKNEMPSAEESDSPLSLARTESFEMQKDYQIMEKINIMNGACNLVTRDHPECCRDVQADGDVSMNELPDLDVRTSWPVSVPLMGSFDTKMENAGVEKFLDDPEGCHDVQADGYVSTNELPDFDVRTCLTVAEPLVESFDAEMENADVEKVRINSENCDCVAIDNGVQERIQTTERSNEKEPASSNAKVINWPTASVQERSGNTRETCPSENTCIDVSLANEIQQDMKSKNESNEDESISSNTEIINQPTALMDENSEVTKEHSAAADLCNDVIIYNEVHLEIQSSNDSIEEKPVSSNVTLINQPPASVIESSESPRETSAAVDFCKGESLDDEVDLGMKRTNVNNDEEPISSYVTPMNQHTPASTNVNQPTLVSVEECSEVPGGTCAEEILCSGLTSDTAMQLEIPTANETNKEETISNFVMQKEAIQPVFILLEESLEIPREVCAKDNLGGGVILDDEVQPKNRSTGGSTEEGPSFSCGAVIYEPTLTSIQECSEIKRETQAAEDNKELEGIKSTAVEPSSSAEKGRKRKREMEQKTESIFNCNGFIRSPCEGLRPRAGKDTGHRSRIDISNMVEENPVKKRLRKPSEVSNPRKEKKESTNGSHIHRCDLEGCRMSFKSKAELLLHKRNRCPVPECKKRFSSHKYTVLHQRVHNDDRPLKCPWKGCSMSFKWAWARTEHIRVHTGERPYQCKVENCGLSFRFVSDFSRHRRKTGHYVNSKT